MLIVDDEEHIQTVFRRWFESCDFEVDLAGNGKIAVEKCSESDYDVITMDLEMPVMKGPEAIAAIRKIQPDVPIVVITGYHDRVAQARQCGANKVLEKPLSMRLLEKEVRDVLPADETDPAATG